MALTHKATDKELKLTVIEPKTRSKPFEKQPDRSTYTSLVDDFVLETELTDAYGFCVRVELSIDHALGYALEGNELRSYEIVLSADDSIVLSGTLSNGCARVERDAENRMQTCRVIAEIINPIADDFVLQPEQL